jgi:hypothetical protein
MCRVVQVLLQLQLQLQAAAAAAGLFMHRLCSLCDQVVEQVEVFEEMRVEADRG